MMTTMIRSAGWMLALPLLLVLLLVTAQESNAATRAKKVKKIAPPLAPREQAVAVPQSVLEFSKAADAPLVLKRLHFEVVASSWAPKALSSSSYFPSATGNYEPGNVPMLTINRWREGGLNAFGLEASPKFGLSYMQLSRSGTLPVGAGASATQTMNLFVGRVGAEVKPEADLWGWFEPFINLSLLPSWAVFASSELSDGSSTGMLMVEEVVGLSARAPNLSKALGINNFGVEVGLQAVQGVSGPAGASGVGVFAGTRIEM